MFAVAAGFLDMLAYLVLPLRRKVELRWSGGYSWVAVRLLLLLRREKKPMVYICEGCYMQRLPYLADGQLLSLAIDAGAARADFARLSGRRLSRGAVI